MRRQAPFGRSSLCQATDLALPPAKQGVILSGLTGKVNPVANVSAGRGMGRALLVPCPFRRISTRLWYRSGGVLEQTFREPARLAGSSELNVHPGNAVIARLAARQDLHFDIARHAADNIAIGRIAQAANDT